MGTSIVILSFVRKKYGYECMGTKIVILRDVQNIYIYISPIVMSVWD